MDQMCKITCNAEGGVTYLIVFHPILAPDTYFLTELKATWLSMTDDLERDFRSCLTQKVSPILRTSKGEVLAAFPRSKFHYVWPIVNDICVQRTGPQLLLDTMTLWQWAPKDQIWNQEKEIPT